MCWYITLAVRNSAADKVRALAHAVSAISISESSGTTACSLFERSAVTFSATQGGCSCSLVPSEPQAGAGAHREKLERKGWSRAKVERAIASSSEANARHAKEISEAERCFREFVAKVLNECAEVQLYRHMYRGSFVTERLPVPVVSHITREQFLSGGFPAESVVSVRVAG